MNLHAYAGAVLPADAERATLVARVFDPAVGDRVWRRSGATVPWT
ncbi:hypothetical protein ACFSVJ_02835 [Prauserella oleivorans]